MMLAGTFDVFCPGCGHVDRVQTMTISHYCSQCGNKSVNLGSALLTCGTPDCTAHDLVAGATMYHECSGCGAQCRKESASAAMERQEPLVQPPAPGDENEQEL